MAEKFYRQTVKINFSDYDLTGFNIKEGLFCGIPAKLITPNDITVKFTQKTKIFRSSIWDLDGNLLSGSFYKFSNLFENPENFPFHNDGDKIFVEKIDGSTNCIDFVNNQISQRTRGCFSYIEQKNYKDFEYCLTDKIVNWIKNNSNYTLITEITTPNNIIVINYYNEAKLWLTGVVDKENYKLIPQEFLDNLAVELDLLRPRTYKYSSIEESILDIKSWKNKEGICVYNEKYGSIHKIKSDEYLARHRFKSNATLANTIDLFFSFNCPDKIEFEKLLVQNFDFECFQMVEQFVPIIISTYNKLLAEIHDINNFILPYYLVPKSRKEVALAILAKYKESGLSPFVFQIYDKKVLDLDSKRKMFNILLEKNEN